jgi:hypothetical protein
MTETNPPSDAPDDTAEFARSYLRKVKHRRLEDQDFSGYIGGGTDKTEWERITQLREAAAKSRYERNLLRVTRHEDRVADGLLSELISRHFPKANWREQGFLKDEIKDYFDTYDEWEDKYAVEHVRKLVKAGVAGVRKRRRASKHYWRGFLRYGWTVTVNLVVLLLAAMILDAASTRFETLAFSLLILIYTRLVIFTRGWAVQNSQNLLGINAEFRRLRYLVGEEDSQDEKGALKSATQRVNKELVGLFIAGAFSSILLLIVLWHIWQAFS